MFKNEFSCRGAHETLDRFRERISQAISKLWHEQNSFDSFDLQVVLDLCLPFVFVGF